MKGHHKRSVIHISINIWGVYIWGVQGQKRALKENLHPFQGTGTAEVQNSAGTINLGNSNTAADPLWEEKTNQTTTATPKAEKQRGMDSLWLTSGVIQPGCLGWEPWLGAAVEQAGTSRGWLCWVLSFSGLPFHFHGVSHALSCSSEPKQHHRCGVWATLMEALLVCLN